MFRHAAIVAALLAMASSQAAAKVYVALTNQTHETSNYLTSVPLPLDDAGNTVAKFTLAAPSRVMITFSAECRTGAPQTGTSVKIVVDGTAVAPTTKGRGIVFCNYDQYGTHSVTVTKPLPAGLHHIRIYGNGYAAHFWYIRYSSLVVFD